MAIEGNEGTTDPADLSDAELERLQRIEDGEDPEAEETVIDEAAAASAAAPAPTLAPSPAPTPAPSPAPAAAKDAGAEDGKPKGVMSKDGERVLPYSALQAERRSARAAASRAERAEAELAAAKQQIADMKAGKTPIEDVTEDDVKQMEEDFPAQGAKLRALWEKAQSAAPAPAQKPDDKDDDPVATTQELIDQVPLLLEWQHDKDKTKFDRAAEVDAMLKKSPKWADKPPLDRFWKVAEMVADEYDVPFEKPKSSSTAAPAAPAQAPAPAAAAPTPAVPAEPARRAPETLSDFKHGATPDHGSLDIARASAPQLLNKFMDMSDEDIDRQLAKLG